MLLVFRLLTLVISSLPPCHACHCRHCRLSFGPSMPRRMPPNCIVATGFVNNITPRLGFITTVNSLAFVITPGHTISHYAAWLNAINFNSLNVNHHHHWLPPFGSRSVAHASRHHVTPFHQLVTVTVRWSSLIAWPGLVADCLRPSIAVARQPSTFTPTTNWASIPLFHGHCQAAGCLAWSCLVFGHQYAERRECVCRHERHAIAITFGAFVVIGGLAPGYAIAVCWGGHCLLAAIGLPPRRYWRRRFVHVAMPGFVGCFTPPLSVVWLVHRRIGCHCLVGYLTPATGQYQLAGSRPSVVEQLFIAPGKPLVAQLFVWSVGFNAHAVMSHWSPAFSLTLFILAVISVARGRVRFCSLFAHVVTRFVGCRHIRLLLSRHARQYRPPAGHVRHY